MQEQPKRPECLDYYNLLGIHQNAPYAKFANAYKSLRLIYHPDSHISGARPSTKIFQNIGIAWNTLKDNDSRRKYDKAYPKIRAEWNVYKINLGRWNAEQQENAKGQARSKEEICRREAEAAHERERLLDELRRVRVESQRQNEAHAKAMWEKAQKERELTKDNGPSQQEPDENDRLRTLWREKQDRTREQARKAEAANKEAAQKRLQKQQEEGQQTNKDQERERLAAKQQAADERQAKVIADAQERQTRAAEERLRQQQHDFKSLKRPRADDIEHVTKRSMCEKDIPSSPKKHMAREQARHKHHERLTEVGGIGNEFRLRDEIIDLGWTHEEYQNEACPQCYTKKSAALFGLWRCPEGGALCCRPCLVSLSTFGT